MSLFVVQGGENIGLVSTDAWECARAGGREKEAKQRKSTEQDERKSMKDLSGARKLNDTERMDGDRRRHLG